MDVDTTLENLEVFISSGVDIIIEYQHEYRLGLRIADRLSRTGIPILAVDVAVPGAYYFDANNYEAGSIAGLMLAEEAGRRWPGLTVRLIVVTDWAAGETAEDRVNGTIDAFNGKTRLPADRITVINAENDPLNAERIFSSRFSALAGEAYAGCLYQHEHRNRNSQSAQEDGSCRYYRRCP